MNLDLTNISLILFSTAIISIGVLGLLVFLNDRRSATNRSFFMFSLMTVIWSALNFLSFQFRSAEITLVILRAVVFSGVWHAFSIFLLFYVFPEERKRFPWWIKFVLLPASVAISTATLTPLIFRGIAEMSPMGGAIRVANGPAMLIFGLFVLGLIFGGFAIFVRKFLAAKDGTERGRYKFVLIGASIFFLFLVIFNFILPAFFDVSFYIKLSAIFILPFVGSTAYAIYKHKLFNVKVIATEILVFIIWLAVLVELLLAETWRGRIIESGIFIFTAIFGILIIRSVLKEVRQKEELEKLSKELAAANEHLKELDELKSDFVSIASHQLRSPLTAIKGYSSMVLEGSFGKVNKKVRDASEKIFQSSERLMSFVNELLDVSRIERGKMEYNFEEADFVAIAQSVCEELKMVAEKKGLKLECHSSSFGAVQLKLDQNKIRQVVQNLLDNAIKYTPQGRIDVRLARQDKNIELTITDTGVGIATDDIDQLFDKFARAKGIIKVDGTGTGLGLYVAREIARGHGGDVFVASAGKGQGSTFTLRLPVNRG